MFSELGRLLMLLGILIFVIGIVLTFAGRIPGLGNLPGDISVQRGNFRLYAPIGTMIVLSIILTIILNVLARFFR